MSDLLGILALWRGRSGLLLLGLLVSLASLATAVALLGASGTTVVAALAGLPLGGALALRLLGPARVVLRYAERIVTHDATFRALADLRVWFFRGLARGRAGGLGLVRTGDVLSRLVGDVETLDGLYLRILVPWVCVVCLLPVLLVLSWPLGLWTTLLLALLALSCVVLLPVAAARAAWSGGARMADARSEMRVAALDALAGLREVRAFAAEGRMLAAVQAREATLLGAGRALAQETARFGAAAGLCASLAVLVVLATGYGASPARIAGVAFVVVAFFEAAAALPRAGVLAGHAAAAARRVLQAAREPAPVPDPPAPLPLPASTALRFEAIRFAWSAERAPVLDGLTMEVAAGARAALLGPSGSGKSSLAALLLKLAAPQAGRILLGGRDLGQLAAAEVRARVAWLGQASHLFADTIRANLLLARPQADEQQLWSALDAAQIGDVVRALPEGLDTWLGEGGTGVSAGQGRRLALARALLSPAPILLLDEPCAGLDAETERAFLTTLNGVGEGRTVLLLVHRLTGVERLDRIWRVSAGRAVAAAG